MSNLRDLTPFVAGLLVAILIPWTGISGGPVVQVLACFLATYGTMRLTARVLGVEE